MAATTASGTVTMGSVAKTVMRTVTVYGLGDYRFHLIHITGLVSLSISAAASVYVLFLLSRPRGRSLWSRPIGERLVVYLAVFDLLYSISHVLDHGYMEAIRDHPPDVACAIFAFFLYEFVIAQLLLVTFTAINAFTMVVVQKRLGLGCRDWRLLAVALSLPFTLGVLGCATGNFGPGEMWCLIDKRRKIAPLLNNIVLVSTIVTFAFAMALPYAAVWFKISRAKRQKTSNQSTKYHRTARIMMLFVALFFAQWWAYVAYSVWGYFGDNPHIVVRWASVCFSNLGGVFHLATYTLVRRKYQAVQGTSRTVRTHPVQGAIQGETLHV